MDPVALFQQWQQMLHKAVLPLLYPLIVSSVLLLSFLYLLKRKQPSRKFNLPPSPRILPIIGNLHQISSPPYRSISALAKNYGNIMLVHFGNIPTVIVSSADMAHDIIKNHDVVFANRPQTTAAEVFFYGCSDLAFSPYGDYWRHVRRISVLELLSQKRVQQFQFVREEVVAKMVENIRLSCLKGDKINLSEMLISASTDIISRSAFGRIYESKGGEKKFGELVKKLVDLLGRFCFKDTVPLLGFIDDLNGFSANLRNTSKSLHDFLDQVIEEHIALKRDNKKFNETDIVDILLDLQKQKMLDFDLTREKFKAILLGMFVAGADTTATTMEWAMAELLKKPGTLRKAQEEVRRVVGNKSSVDESFLNEMVYLKCIVKETLRLHAPAILITRETSASVKLGSYDIPPKTRVMINAWAIQRDPNIWEKPEEFIPERFINNPVDVNGQHAHFIPFGAGRRICPGMAYALKEVEYVLACLLFLFDWKLPGGARGEDLDMTDVFSLISRRKLPLIVVPVVHST